MPEIPCSASAAPDGVSLLLTTIAQQTGLRLFADTVGSSRGLVAQIDHARAFMPPRPVSDAQRAYIAVLIKQTWVQPLRGWPDALSNDEASVFITRHKGGMRKATTTQKRMTSATQVKRRGGAAPRRE